MATTRQRRGDGGAHRAAAGRVGATVAAGGGDATGAKAAGASSGDGQRGGASTAASRRSTEEADRALAAEIKTWKESDARMPALLAEPSVAVEKRRAAVLLILLELNEITDCWYRSVKHAPPERHGHKPRPGLFQHSPATCLRRVRHGNGRHSPLCDVRSDNRNNRLLGCR